MTKTKLLDSLLQAHRCLPAFLILFAITGCAANKFDSTMPQPKSEMTGQLQPEPMLLRDGDTLSISVPGSPTLDTTQTIRTDGKINLALLGEVVAAGKTPEDLQNELLNLYQPQVAAKQVVVTVTSPNIPVYVTGAVLRPGPVAVNHPISVLDAIMEAGGFDYATANLKAVVVVRQEKDQTVRRVFNLKKAMAGSQVKPFYLKPYDIVYVPERFTWY